MASAAIYARSSNAIEEDAAGNPAHVLVYLRLTHKGKRAATALGLRLKKSDWNDLKRRVRASHPRHHYLNQRISRYEAAADEAILYYESKGIEPWPRRVRDRLEARLKGGSEGDGSERGAEKQETAFLLFARETLDGYRRRGQISTFKSYRAVVNKLEDFLAAKVAGSSGTDLMPRELTAGLLTRFRTYLYEEMGNGPNTVGKALRVLRTLYRAAQREGHVRAGLNPFADLTIDSAPVKKEKLTPHEMQKLQALDLSSAPGGGEASLLAEVRRWFLFAYYTGGMRFSDVATLRWHHVEGGRVSYKMQKTADNHSLPLSDKARAILEYYRSEHADPKKTAPNKVEPREVEPGNLVFGIIEEEALEDPAQARRQIESMNALANKYLKKLARKAGLDVAPSFHLARHTAAWKAYEELGDVYKVMKILGHASIEQTEQYLKGFDDTSLDDDFLDAFS